MIQSDLNQYFSMNTFYAIKHSKIEANNWVSVYISIHISISHVNNTYQLLFSHRIFSNFIQTENSATLTPAITCIYIGQEGIL